MSPGSTFAINRGHLRTNLSYSYARFTAQDVFNQPMRWNSVLLKDVLREKLMNGIFKTKEYYGSGVPLVNVYDLYQDTEIHLDQLERIDVSDEELNRYGISKGDVFFVRSSLKPEGVAWTSVIGDMQESAVFECHLIRVRVDDAKIQPEFLSYYCQTELARRYLLSRASVTTMATIDQGSIQDLPIILPPLDVQKHMVLNLKQRRTLVRRQIQQANRSLSTIDSLIIRRLGIQPVSSERQTSYAVRLGELKFRRYDAHFYNPYFGHLMQRIREVRHFRLGDLVGFSNQQWNPDETDVDAYFRYIEISGVNIQTGEVETTDIQVSEAPSRARMIVQSDDIIISLTRPHHGAIALIDEELGGAIASTGFAIVRDINSEIVTRDYLFHILRTKLCLMQFLQRSSGGNYPAITEDELSNVYIPVPDLSDQTEIVTEISRIRDNAKHLIRTADNEWNKEMDLFEKQLFKLP